MAVIKNIIVVIMRGISGAGKSTLVKKLEDHFLFKMDWESFTCSADSYFMINDKYEFNPHLLTEAHSHCFNTFLEDMKHAEQLLDEEPDSKGCVIFVDNTNTERWEYTPYYLGAESQGFKPMLLQVNHNTKECIKQNLHEVHEKAIKAMAKRFEKSLPWHNQIEAIRDVDIESLCNAIIED